MPLDVVDLLAVLASAGRRLYGRTALARPSLALGVPLDAAALLSLPPEDGLL